MNCGAYILILILDDHKDITVGALGELHFSPGALAYVGSAMGGLEQRIARHLREDKRLHWHIDYLLQHARITRVIRVPAGERLECQIAAALAAKLEAVPGFGCSDCRCVSHLFRNDDPVALQAAVEAAVAQWREAG